MILHVSVGGGLGSDLESVIFYSEAFRKASPLFRQKRWLALMQVIMPLFAPQSGGGPPHSRTLSRCTGGLGCGVGTECAETMKVKRSKIGNIVDPVSCFHHSAAIILTWDGDV